MIWKVLRLIRDYYLFSWECLLKRVNEKNKNGKKIINKEVSKGVLI